MTVGQGYPDYQDYPNWRGLVYEQTNGEITSGAPLVVSEYVTNYASTYIFASAAGIHGITVQIDFYTDSTETYHVASWSYTVPSGSQAPILVPNLGNYIVVTVTTSSALATTITVVIAPSNSVTDYPVCPIPDSGLIVQNTIVDSSSAYTANKVLVLPGLGYLYFNPHGGAANFTCLVYEIDADGTILGTVAKVQAPSGPTETQFIAGTNALQLDITSTSATANQIDATVRVIPR